jgi:predicted flap endonuclease-1-like 5' DNA nuclease
VAGWLLEIFHWRWKRQARIVELEAQLRGCHNQVTTLQQELANKTGAAKPMAPPVAAEVKAVSPAAAEVKARSKMAKAKRAASEGIPARDLAAIAGIGPIFERKLFDAGILTFADLASKTVAELEAIIQPRNWQKVDLAGWIAEAQARAGSKVQ